MALPANRDIEIYRGDPYEHDVTWTHGGQPVDLTAGTGVVEARAQIRATPDGALLHEFTTDVSAAEADGKIVMTLTADQTAELPVESVWDVELRPQGGQFSTWMRGRVHCEPDVTRA